MEVRDFVGETIADRYRVLEIRGQGGMATVYRADDLLLRRRVALKRIREPYAADPAFLARFRQEAWAAARFTHPNIIAVHDLIDIDGTPALILEEAEGPSLAQALRALGPPPLHMALVIGHQLCQALQAAHKQGLVHRDVKPGNVLFTRPLPSDWDALIPQPNEPLVKLADFGLVRALGEASLSVPGQVMGTPYYVSPEQAQGEPGTPSSDLYSLGVLLYEILTGQRPFTGDTPLAIARQHVETPPPPLREVAPHIPAAVERIVMTALEKTPEERFASADEMSTALGQVMSAGLAVTAAMGTLPSDYQPPPPLAFEQRPPTLPLVTPDDPVQHTNATATPPEESVAPVLTQVRTNVTRAPATSQPTPAPKQTPIIAPWRRLPIQPRWLGLGLLLLALIIGIFGFLSFASFLSDALSPTMVQAPSVVGLTGAAAKDRLTQAGLGYAEKAPVESRSAPAGSVVEQTPAPDGQIRSGATVTVALSQGPPQVSVVDVRYLSYVQAATLLQSAGLQVVRREEVNAAAPDTVIRQDPASGASVPVDSSVTLTVSLGNRVAVPNVEGTREKEAEDRLEAAGFTVQKRNSDRPGGGCKGCVISTDPGAGTLLPPGSEVVIVVRD